MDDARLSVTRPGMDHSNKLERKWPWHAAALVFALVSLLFYIAHQRPRSIMPHHEEHEQHEAG